MAETAFFSVPLERIKPIAKEWFKEVVNEFFTGKEPETSNPEELLTPEEAAKFLKCTTTSLWRMRKAGTIRLYGLAGKRFYKRSELLNSLEEIKG